MSPNRLSPNPDARRATRTTPRRRAVLGTALTLTATLVAACGGGSSPDRGDSAPAAAPGPSALADASGVVEVTMWHGLGGAAGEALQAQVDAFNAANAGVVQASAVYQGSYADTLAKYTAAVRDGSTPSVLVASDVSTGFVHDAGQTISAQAMSAANPDDLDLDELRAAARGYYTADGELLAVPLATSMPLLYVDDAALDATGIDRSTLGTLDGVAAAARAIHARDPAVAGIVQPLDGWWFEQLTAAAGAAYCTPDNGRSGTGAEALDLTGPAQAQAISTMAGLYTDGVALNTGADGNAALSAFAAGEVAMMLNSSGAIGNLAAAGATGYTALPYPVSGPQGSSGPLIGGAAMWVDGSGSEPAEQVAGWKLVSFLASAAAQEPFTQASGYAPVNTAVDDSPTEQRFLAENPAYQTLLDQFSSTPASPATAGCLSGAMPGVRSAVVERLEGAFTGSVPVADALEQAQEAATAAIGDYREQAGR